MSDFIQISELTPWPAPDMVEGIHQKPIKGVSMAYSFDKAKADVPSPHQTQYLATGSAGSSRGCPDLRQGDYDR